jgi:hypothetical protein
MKGKNIDKLFIKIILLPSNVSPLAMSVIYGRCAIQEEAL